MFFSFKYIHIFLLISASLFFLYLDKYNAITKDSPPAGLGNRAPLVPVGVAGFTTGVGVLTVPTVTGTPRVPNGKYGESGG